jgi:Icc-related predicted phosphoesterase
MTTPRAAPHSAGSPAIRVAALADVHFATDSAGRLRPHLEDIRDRADLLVIAGDLTTCGDPDEAATLAEELRGVDVPVFAVLGNHDFHAGREGEVWAAIERAGVRVLEGNAAVFEIEGVRVGVAGVKGFGGGFAGACGAEFGEPEMKAFIRHTRSVAEGLEGVLAELDADVRVALLHYAPVKATLVGERLEIYPFLGSYLLAEAVDRGGADIVFHGHAHRGTEKGVTPGGIHVRNVALPVIRHAYNVYSLDGGQPEASTAQ